MEHLALNVLERIENVLRLIPPQHLRGRSLEGGIKGGAGGAASFYNPGERGITIVTPPGVADPSRKVMGGGSGGSLGGNLVEWTVRHELGHGVDKQIKFTNQRSMQARFGGWKRHPNADRGAEGDAEVAGALLANAGFDYLDQEFTADNRWRARTNTLPSIVASNNILTRGAGTDLRIFFPDFVANIELHDQAFQTKWTRFLALRAKALSEPWTTADGGGDDLERDGRLYFVDSYGKWVSCLAEKRNSDSLSRYMFSTPGEWFAEAYAAYYAPDEATRDQLSRDVRAWFGRELGVPTNKRSQGGTEEGDTPALATEGDDSHLSKLQPALQDLADAVEGLTL